jgi:hypothetical protein
VPKDNTLRPPRSGPSIGSERGCFTPSARYKDEEISLWHQPDGRCHANPSSS